MTAIDISETMKTFCGQLGVEYQHVMEIQFLPQQVTVTSYAPDEHGHPHVDPETNELIKTVEIIGVIA
jgi:hypothetical protein